MDFKMCILTKYDIITHMLPFTAHVLPLIAHVLASLIGMIAHDHGCEI